jgi:hypothetical protein
MGSPECSGNSRSSVPGDYPGPYGRRSGNGRTRPSGTGGGRDVTIRNLSVFHTENKNSPNKRMQLFNACRKLFGITYVVAIVYKRREKES